MSSYTDYKSLQADVFQYRVYIPTGRCLPIQTINPYRQMSSYTDYKSLLADVFQ